MRSLATLRYPAAAGALAVLAAVAAHLADLSVSLPIHQLRMAWTLTRVLIQL